MFTTLLASFMDPKQIRIKVTEAIACLETVGIIAAGPMILDVVKQLESCLVSNSQSSRIRCLIGDLLYLATPSSSDVENERLRLYLTAIEVDPFDPEPYQSLGFLHLGIDDRRAATYFELSLASGETFESCMGLAEAFHNLGLMEDKMKAVVRGEEFLDVRYSKLNTLKNDLKLQ